jgi:hypothetical protein
MRTFIVAVVAALSLGVSNANAHYVPGTHNSVHAIQLAFCGKSNTVCWEGNNAISVAKCESGKYWYEGTPFWARNGQYRGMFQMGSWERATYGHGPDPWKQAFAAHRYYVASGRDWSPWECKP